MNSIFRPLPSSFNEAFTRADTRIVLFEGISPTAVSLLEQAGYTGVTLHKKALEGDALVEAVRGAHVIGIRSRTQLTEHVLRSAGPLMAVGCFCIGTDQVDLTAAAAFGIPVFNAPFSNTRSVAELTIGEIVMLLRRITPRSAAPTPAAGTSRPRAATRFVARRWASSATATSAASSPPWPKPWACG